MLDDLSVMPWWLAPDATIDEPAIAVAGDTWKWTKSFPAFRASDGYSLAYYFANPGNAFSIVGAPITTNGDQFVIAFAATAALVPGRYRWQGYVTLAGVRTTAVEGWLTVTPNLAAGKPVDVRSHVRATLDAIEALIAGRMLTDTGKYTIGNRSLEKLTPTELIKARYEYRWLWFHEQRRERIANGLDDGKRLYARFNRG